MVNPHMATLQTLAKADVASALAWLVEAGLDTPISDMPASWLSAAATAEAPPPPTLASPQKLSPIPAPARLPSAPDLGGIDSLNALEAALLSLAHPLQSGQQRLFAGAQGAPLLVLSEMPLTEGSDEARLLAAMLAAIGIDDGMAASVCILPWPTRGQRPARDDDIALFAPFATRALDLMAPKLILALGARAASLAAPDAAPATLRGRWLTLADRPMVATFAPGMLLRQPRLKADAWADLQRLAEKLSA